MKQGNPKETNNCGDPLPVQMLAPWLQDNQTFQQELNERNTLLRDLSSIRDRLDISIVRPVERCTLAAVDAADCSVECGDQLSILVQAVHVADDGTTAFSDPIRNTGVNGHEFRLVSSPTRIAAECCMLAAAETPTIADLSYWSFLMDVNQAITNLARAPTLKPLRSAVDMLVNKGTFLTTITNPNIIPMTKTSQSDTLIPGVSDRHVLSKVLNAGEYTAPRLLTEGTGGEFGVEKRGFSDQEREQIRHIYKTQLGLVFFKPHPWSRAYRIEGYLDRLGDESILMALLAAIHHHTADVSIVEPWPQFMADFTAKKISGVARLYGSDNWHRYPEANYMKARTR